MFDHVYSRAASADRSSSRPGSPATRPRSRGVSLVTTRTPTTVGADQREPAVRPRRSTPGCAGRCRRPQVLLMGEDIGPLGGVFRVTEGLQAEFGEQRVLDTPLAESGIVGTAIGLAMRGFRPVVRDPVRRLRLPRLRPDHLAAGQDHATGTRARVSMPVVIRIPYGGHIGAIEHHQESPEAYFAHTPGLRVVSPSTPNDAYWMIQEAIASQRPGDLLRAQEPLLAEGRGRLRRARRSRCTPAASCAAAPTSPLVGHGAMVSDAAAGRRARRSRGHQPRGHRPALALARSTTGRSSTRCAAPAAWSTRRRPPGFVSVGSEIAATVMERAFYSLEAPVLRVSGFDTPFPPAKLEGTSCPMPTASSKPSTAPSPTNRHACRKGTA